jgi:hypothetical protein
MKTTRALVMGLALIATTAANAQDIAGMSMVKRSNAREESRKTLNFSRVETNYLNNLNSEVPGVVESALGHITLMRIAYPRQDLRKLQEKLYDLASKGETRSIRYKAFIAMQVFGNPGAFKESILGRDYSGDGLLEEIAAQR